MKIDIKRNNEIIKMEDGNIHSVLPVYDVSIDIEIGELKRISKFDGSLYANLADIISIKALYGG